MITEYGFNFFIVLSGYWKIDFSRSYAMRFCVRSKPFLFNNRGGSTAARGGYKNLTAVFPLPYFDGLVG